MTITLTLRAMTPDAVPDDAPSSRLLAALTQRAAYARAGRQDGAGPGGHALSALCLGEALVNRIRAERWALVEVALRAGVPLPTVGDALGGWDCEEVRVGYSMAVDARVAAGKLTPADADALYRLVGDGPDGR